MINALLVFFDGILTFISPCLLPLLPVYIFYLTGSTVEDYQEGNINKTKVFINSLGFMIGFTIVFIALGALASSFGQLLKQHREFIRVSSGVVIVIFGLNFLGILNLKFFNLEKRISYEVKQLRFFSAIAFGMVFAFSWTPCGSKYLGFALGLAANSNTVLSGVFLLFLYSIGLGIPLVLTAVIFDKIKEGIRGILRYTKVINIISGVMLIVAGLLIVFDKLNFIF